MESIQFKSNIAYMSFGLRLWKYTSVILLGIKLGLPAVAILIFAVMLQKVYIILATLFLAIPFLGLIFYVNYFFLAKEVQYYIEEIILDTQQKICYIKYYYKNTPKKEQIPFKSLDIKLESMYLGVTQYELCFYKEKKKILSQFCGVGYWSKEICETYHLLKRAV